ncbi:MAG: S1 family peptidase [Gemmatimonadaceae bacterium]
MSSFRGIFEQYAGAVAYVEVVTPAGDVGVGTAFHVGGGVFLTARHVVAGNTVRSIATTHDSSEDGLTISHKAGAGALRRAPLYHPDPAGDLAVLAVDGSDAPAIPIGQIDPNETPLLAPVLVMGYPPIPRSREPVLVVASAEVSAVVESYDGAGLHIILSSMARGGLSGGVAYTPCDANGNEGVLGVITSAFVRNGLPEELGYLAVMPLDTAYSCNRLYTSRLDWYVFPGRQAAAEQLVRERPLDMNSQ